MPQKCRLEAFGAVLIEGPKWTGKTTTAERIARSVIKLHDPDMAANNTWSYPHGIISF